MTPLRELLARVATHPDDMDARLACARALSAEDAPRAELIQAQVTLAGRGVDPARRMALGRRVEALLQAHEEVWAGRLRSLGASDFQFSRGFVGEVSLSDERLAEQGDALLALEPVSRLRLKVKDGKGLARAVAMPWFDQIQGLHLSGKGVSAALSVLASAAHTGRLAVLVLSSVKREGMAALLKSQTLPALRSISLTGNEGVGDEVCSLLASTTLTLSRLYLSGTGVSDEGVAALARARPLQSLEMLALNRNEITDEGLEALAASKVLVNLERLELERNELSAEGLLAFRSPKALPKLRLLLLRNMYMSTRELAPLHKRLGNGLWL